MDDYINPKGKTGAVIGSSTCFGIGATSDSKTLSSQLSNLTGIPWFNLSGSAFLSTQELMQFITYIPKKLSYMVIFSGVNNQALCNSTAVSTPFISSYFDKSKFEDLLEQMEQKRQMADYFKENRFFEVMKSLMRDFLFKSKPKIETQPREKSYNDLMSSFRRDMAVWSHLSKSMKFKLYFVYQPFEILIKKNLSPEEKKLFDLCDSPGEIRSRPHILKTKDKYLKDMEEIFNDLDISFININEKNSFTKKEWLFMDRVHLTDRGLEVSAKEIKKELDL